MNHPVYELREFEPTDKCPSQSDIFMDLYLIKKGNTKIGIKIRDPDLTDKGNYKFNKVQVKQQVKTVHGLQGWCKTKIKLEDKFKLKQDNLQQLNNILRKELMKLPHRTQELEKWTQSPIDYAIQARKCKQKYGGNQQAVVSFKKAFSKAPPIVMKSWAIEDQDPEKLMKRKEVEKIHNTSYPQILERLFLTGPLI